MGFCRCTATAANNETRCIVLFVGEEKIKIKQISVFQKIHWSTTENIKYVTIQHGRTYHKCVTISRVYIHVGTCLQGLLDFTCLTVFT